MSVAKQLSSLDFQKDVEPHVAKKMKTERFNGTFYDNACEDDNDFNWGTALSSAFRAKPKEMASGSIPQVFSTKSETLSSGLCEKAMYSQQKPRHEVLKEPRFGVSRVLPSAEGNDSISLGHKSLLEKSYLKYNSLTDTNCHSAGSIMLEEDVDCIVKAGTLRDGHIDDGWLIVKCCNINLPLNWKYFRKFYFCVMFFSKQFLLLSYCSSFYLILLSML